MPLAPGQTIITAQMPESLVDRAKAVGDAEERSFSAVVRRALNQYIDQRRESADRPTATV